MTICMKSQILFSGKNTNIINLSAVDFAHSMLNVFRFTFLLQRHISWLFIGGGGGGGGGRGMYLDLAISVTLNWVRDVTAHGVEMDSYSFGWEWKVLSS